MNGDEHVREIKNKHLQSLLLQANGVISSQTEEIASLKQRCSQQQQVLETRQNELDSTSRDLRMAQTLLDRMVASIKALGSTCSGSDCMDVIRTVLGDYSPAGDAKVVVEPSAASVPGKGSVLHSRGPSDGDESCILANVLKERDELEIELLERYAELRHASQ
ncbi:MAG: hypothetical protein SGCHY_005504, partial [Lobulomycetales sp.]